MRRVLEFLVLMYADNLKGRDPFDMRIEQYKSSLATFSSNYLTIDKL